MRIKFLRPRTTAGLRFRQVGKSSSAGRSWKRQRRFQSVSAYLNNWPDQLNADPLSLWVLGAVLVDQGRWLAFINSKGIAMPEFQVSYEIARYLAWSRYGTAGAEFSRTMQAYSPPVHRNGATARQLSWSQTTEIVGGRFQGGTPGETTN
jgi:hypothetical protein